MTNGTKIISKTHRKTKQIKLTPAEAIYGVEWVRKQWDAAKGILKGKGPKDPVAWQRKIRKEWDARY